MHRHYSSTGFTLLELLVVLSILAIIAGGLISAYEGIDDQAAEGVSAHTLAALDSSLRAHVAYEGALPNRLDSLLAAAVPASPGTPVAAAGAERFQLLTANMIGTKAIGPVALTTAQFNSLAAAGLTELRYVDPAGNDLASPAPGSGTTVTLTATDTDGVPAVVGPLLDIDIPSRAFETPRPGSGRNRGRGYLGALGPGSPVLQWNGDRSGGGGGYDNIKIGADPEDIIFVFGLGNDATVIGTNRGPMQLSSAPIYGNLRPTEYARYFVLVNTGPAAATFPRAKLQVVMNTDGDFIDEMISEYRGQKP